MTSVALDRRPGVIGNRSKWSTLSAEAADLHALWQCTVSAGPRHQAQLSAASYDRYAIRSVPHFILRMESFKLADRDGCSFELPLHERSCCRSSTMARRGDLSHATAPYSAVGTTSVVYRLSVDGRIMDIVCPDEPLSDQSL